MRLVPLLPTLRGYRRSWLGPDLVAGMTLVAIAVPEQMATARLANMPALTGLYAFIAGSVMFALVGTHGQMSVGADSTIAPVFAAGVGAAVAVGTPAYAHLVTFCALLVGFVLIVVGCSRLGWIADFLSAPVVTGILAGLSVEITVRQLPAGLGIAGGGTTTADRLRTVVDQVRHLNGWTVTVTVTVVALALLGEAIDRRIPGPLLGLVVSIAAVILLGLKSHGVETVGAVHASLPAFGVSSIRLDDVRRIWVPALTVAFICVVQTATTAQTSTSESGRPDNLNRDLIGVGAGNMLAGLTGSFPVDASPPRTAAVDTAGGRTQLSGLVAAATVLVVLALATGLLKDLPQATLAAILLFVATRLFHAGELRRIWRFDHFEFALATITAAVVAFAGIEQGVVVAILLALAQRTRLAARPRDAVLGREPGTDHWIPPDVGRTVESVPGVVVYLLYAPLWYGNAGFFVTRVREALSAAPTPARAFVLDCNGISDIDYTAARALGRLAAELRTKEIRIGVARASHLVHHDLAHSGLLDAIGPTSLFASVEDAVEALGAAKPPTPRQSD